MFQFKKINMAFNLRRVRDGEGEQGGLSQSIKWDGGKELVVTGYVPTLGESMKVGSVVARSYSDRDWWMTTEITEIIEEIKNDDVFYVKFKTGNSEYEWWNGVYPK